MSKSDKKTLSLAAAQAVFDRLCRDDWMDHAPQDELLRGLAREMRLAEGRFRKTLLNRKRVA